MSRDKDGFYYVEAVTKGQWLHPIKREKRK